MTDDRALDELAEQYGIALVHHGLDGTRHDVPRATTRRILDAFGIEVGGGDAIRASLDAARDRKPPVMRAAPGERCFLPDWLRDSRAWGISLQLYELRSRRNWGIGDFADLAEACAIAARAGADFVGLNPLHALFLAAPDRRSPFSPSSRRFLNPLYIAVDQVPGFSSGMADPSKLAALREGDLVDYPAVARAKLAALEAIWRGWRSGSGDPGLPSEDFQRFRAEQGEALEAHALFEALSAQMVREGRGSGWMDWPEAFRDMRGAAVAAFRTEHADEVEFHAWLQWLAARQLAAAARAGREAGLRVGLYLDFAVGEAPDGSATWSDRRLYLTDMSVGAPPDFFTANGQDWGLSPLSPVALAADDATPFRRMMEAVLRDAGALRIDHAMSLWQLFFVPAGGKPAEGAYVRYPIEAMLAALAQSSRDARAIVIGEDLGIVPEGFRDVMAESGIFSYRILYFEGGADGFLPPQDYPRLALACLSTHDLPTLAGWWRGDDVALRREHGLIDEEAAAHQASERQRARTALVKALAEAGALDPDQAARLAQAGDALDEAAARALSVAAHLYVARTPSLLAGVRLADLTAETRPTNLPGTVDSYPNWRPKCSVPLEDLEADENFKAITQAMAAERPRRT